MGKVSGKPVTPLYLKSSMIEVIIEDRSNYKYEHEMAGALKRSQIVK